MEIDDILKNLDGKEFNLNPGELQVMLLRYLIRIEINQGSILKRQIKIIEMLNGKTGQELDEVVSEISTDVFDKNHELYLKEFYEEIRKVIS